MKLNKLLGFSSVTWLLNHCQRVAKFLAKGPRPPEGDAPDKSQRHTNELSYGAGKREMKENKDAKEAAAPASAAASAAAQQTTIHVNCLIY